MIGGMDKIGLGIVLQVFNKASGPLGKMNRDFKTTHSRAITTANGINAQTTRMGKSFGGMQSTMFQSMRMMAGAGALLAPVLITGKQAAEFEDQMGAIKSLLVTSLAPEDVAPAMKAIQSTIFETGRMNRTSTDELADSYYKLQSAIGDVNQTQAALKPTADLAVAGMGSMENSVRTMTSLLATYGVAWGDSMTPQEKATRIANILAGTIAAFNTTLPEMSEAMTYSAGPAKVLGVSLQDLTTVLGAAQTAGLQGSVAGTGFSEFLRQSTVLVKNNGEEIDGATLSMQEYLDIRERGASVKGKTSLRDMGLTDDDGMLLSFFDILKKIELQFGITSEKAQEVSEQGLKGSDAFEAMGIKAEYAAALVDAFGARGSRIIQVLLGQADALKVQSKEIETSDNLTKMLNARQESLIARLAMTKNRFTELAVTIGEQLLPAQKKAGETDWVDNIQEAIEGVTEWAKDNPVKVNIGLKTTIGAAGLLGGAALARLLFGVGKYGAQALGFAATATGASVTIAVTLVASAAANVYEVMKLSELHERAAKGDIGAASEILARRAADEAFAQAQGITGGYGVHAMGNLLRQALGFLTADVEDKWDIYFHDMDAFWGLKDRPIDRPLFMSKWPFMGVDYDWAQSMAQLSLPAWVGGVKKLPNVKLRSRPSRFNLPLPEPAALSESELAGEPTTINDSRTFHLNMTVQMPPGLTDQDIDRFTGRIKKNLEMDFQRSVNGRTQ